LYTVYRVENKVNGKNYIGITSRKAEERWFEHLSRTNCSSRNSRLYLAIRKYGSDNFELSVLDYCLSEDEVRQLETSFIKEYDSYNNGYNCNLENQGIYPSKKAQRPSRKGVRPSGRKRWLP
jgi:group I intron endonuclease